jgi:hypothetical protein
MYLHHLWVWGVRKLQPLENNLLMLLFYIIISVRAMIVKNISSIEYFLQRGEPIDMTYRYNVNYHSLAPKTSFDSPHTFVAEFRNIRANSCPLLITEENEMLTEHIWPLLHKYKFKPDSNHKLWKKVNGVTKWT